jgi:hypothetical protein
MMVCPFVSVATVTYPLLGCLIVELLDFRPQKAKDPVLEQPDAQRVVLRPNPETIWADICLMKQKAGATWTDADALEMEARILVSLQILISTVVLFADTAYVVAKSWQHHIHCV